MTNKEYFDITALQKVRMIKDALLDIADKPSDIITEQEMYTIYSVISIWEDKLDEAIEVKN